MRIINALVAIMIAFVIFSNIAIASEANINETKINLKIQDTGVTNSHALFENETAVLLAYDPNNFKNVVASDIKKSEDEAKREKVLARWMAKRPNPILPQGKFVINASAYTAAADECGKSDGITASGLMVRENETIACPQEFPFGTKLKIEGMGTYVCQDRGGAIKGNHVDIYMGTKAQAFKFGRRNLLAEVVK